MRTMIKFIHGEQYRNVRFPCTEKELQILTDSFELPNTAATKLTVDSIGDERLNVLLSGREHNLDELNYLIKRLDSFGENEMNTFCAAARGQKLQSLKDMINLTFNTHCYSLVDDFSDLDRLGKDLYLNQAGTLPSEELKNFDGNAYVEKIIQENPHPMVTPYGIIYENGNQPELLYNGRTFPAYWYEPCPIALELSTNTEKEYLYLPTEKSELEKALQRLGVNTLSEVSIKIEAHNLPENIADLVLTDISEVDTLNSYAARFKDLGEREVSALSALATFVQPKSPEQLSTLMDCMHEFETFPGVHTALHYGGYMISESGRFEHDSNLEDYIDFEAYGKDKISRETGVFTDKGYLLYHGYNMEMQNILHENLGMKIKEPQEQTELKLYMPLKAVTYQDENDYGDLYQVDFEIEVYPDELSCYEDEIRTAVLDRRMDEEKRGMMDYYNEHDTVNAKVQSYVFDVEEVGGKLMGVAVLTLNAPLDNAELEKIKDAITGQASDGFGEGLEQREIHCNGKDVYVSLWGADNWSLQTSDELGIAQPMQGMGGMSHV
ncbi:antirestriction protein ArdA [Hungatella sp.]|uniref:antirestriction protein ArdA n=1 Tax=Hungatella sp. TaxID=2613924 RepID=UPI002A81902B|nr:antirestriction protein ArdA [Hungatella sp.]